MPKTFFTLINMTVGQELTGQMDTEKTFQEANKQEG
jgi:hypothetical protein